MVRFCPCRSLTDPKAARERGTAAAVSWSGGGRRQGKGRRDSHRRHAKVIRGAGGGGGSSSGHNGIAAAAVVTQSSYVQKFTAAGYMSVPNSMMESDFAHSDLVDVSRIVTLPRREKMSSAARLWFLAHYSPKSCCSSPSGTPRHHVRGSRRSNKKL